MAQRLALFSLAGIIDGISGGGLAYRHVDGLDDKRAPDDKPAFRVRDCCRKSSTDGRILIWKAKVMDFITIRTPDSRIFTFPNSEIGRNEARQFVSGFCRCLECFGIWKSGERYIGALGTNIKTFRKEMKDQLPPET